MSDSKELRTQPIKGHAPSRPPRPPPVMKYNPNDIASGNEVQGSFAASHRYSIAKKVKGTTEPQALVFRKLDDGPTKGSEEEKISLARAGETILETFYGMFYRSDNETHEWKLVVDSFISVCFVQEHGNANKPFKIIACSGSTRLMEFFVTKDTKCSKAKAFVKWFENAGDTMFGVRFAKEDLAEQFYSALLRMRSTLMKTAELLKQPDRKKIVSQLSAPGTSHHGKVSLIIKLPNLETTILSVPGLITMSELYELICEKEGLDMSQHLLSVARKGGKEVSYKPDTALGSLNIRSVSIIDLGVTESEENKENKTDQVESLMDGGNEEGRLLDIHLPEGHKTSVRVPADMRVGNLLTYVCKCEGLNSRLYDLQSMDFTHQSLDMNIKVGDLNITEIRLLDKQETRHASLDDDELAQITNIDDSAKRHTIALDTSISRTEDTISKRHIVALDSNNIMTEEESPKPMDVQPAKRPVSNLTTSRMYGSTPDLSTKAAKRKAPPPPRPPQPTPRPRTSADENSSSSSPSPYPRVYNVPTTTTAASQPKQESPTMMQSPTVTPTQRPKKRQAPSRPPAPRRSTKASPLKAQRKNLAKASLSLESGLDSIDKPRARPPPVFVPPPPPDDLPPPLDECEYPVEPLSDEEIHEALWHSGFIPHEDFTLQLSPVTKKLDSSHGQQSKSEFIYNTETLPDKSERSPSPVTSISSPVTTPDLPTSSILYTPPTTPDMLPLKFLVHTPESKSQSDQNIESTRIPFGGDSRSSSIDNISSPDTDIMTVLGITERTFSPEIESEPVGLEMKVESEPVGFEPTVNVSLSKRVETPPVYTEDEPHLPYSSMLITDHSEKDGDFGVPPPPLEPPVGFLEIKPVEAPYMEDTVTKRHPMPRSSTLIAESSKKAPLELEVSFLESKQEIPPVYTEEEDLKIVPPVPLSSTFIAETSHEGDSLMVTPPPPPMDVDILQETVDFQSRTDVPSPIPPPLDFASPSMDITNPPAEFSDKTLSPKQAKKKLLINEEAFPWLAEPVKQFTAEIVPEHFETENTRHVTTTKSNDDIDFKVEQFEESNLEEHLYRNTFSNKAHTEDIAVVNDVSIPGVSQETIVPTERAPADLGEAQLEMDKINLEFTAVYTEKGMRQEPLKSEPDKPLSAENDDYKTPFDDLEEIPSESSSNDELERAGDTESSVVKPVTETVVSRIVESSDDLDLMFLALENSKPETELEPEVNISPEVLEPVAETVILSHSRMVESSDDLDLKFLALESSVPTELEPEVNISPVGFDRKENDTPLDGYVSTNLPKPDTSDAKSSLPATPEPTSAPPTPPVHSPPGSGHVSPTLRSPLYSPREGDYNHTPEYVNTENQTVAVSSVVSSQSVSMEDVVSVEENESPVQSPLRSGAISPDIPSPSYCPSPPDECGIEAIDLPNPPPITIPPLRRYSDLANSMSFVSSALKNEQKARQIQGGPKADPVKPVTGIRPQSWADIKNQRKLIEDHKRRSNPVKTESTHASSQPAKSAPTLPPQWVTPSTTATSPTTTPTSSVVHLVTTASASIIPVATQSSQTNKVTTAGPSLTQSVTSGFSQTVTSTEVSRTSIHSGKPHHTQDLPKRSSWQDSPDGSKTVISTDVSRTSSHTDKPPPPQDLTKRSSWQEPPAEASSVFRGRAETVPASSFSHTRPGPMLSAKGFSLLLPSSYRSGTSASSTTRSVGQTKSSGIPDIPKTEATRIKEDVKIDAYISESSQTGTTKITKFVGRTQSSGKPDIPKTDIARKMVEDTKVHASISETSQTGTTRFAKEESFVVKDSETGDDKPKGVGKGPEKGEEKLKGEVERSPRVEVVMRKKDDDENRAAKLAKRQSVKDMMSLFGANENSEEPQKPQRRFSGSGRPQQSPAMRSLEDQMNRPVKKYGISSLLSTLASKPETKPLTKRGTESNSQSYVLQSSVEDTIKSESQVKTASNSTEAKGHGALTTGHGKSTDEGKGKTQLHQNETRRKEESLKNYSAIGTATMATRSSSPPQGTTKDASLVRRDSRSEDRTSLVSRDSRSEVSTEKPLGRDDVVNRDPPMAPMIETHAFKTDIGTTNSSLKILMAPQITDTHVVPKGRVAAMMASFKTSVPTSPESEDGTIDVDQAEWF